MIKPSIASNFLMNRFNQAVILLITALFIAVIIFIPRFFENHNDAPTSTKTPDNQIKLASETSPVLNPEIIGQAAIIWDRQKKEVLYSKNSDQVRPIASISKLMTAIIALDNLPPDYPIKITATDLVVEGSSGLINGETWDLEDLVNYTLIVSSNDGTESLRRSTEEYTGSNFSELANSIKNKLDLSANSKWQNASGLDLIDGVEASNTASASDVIKLMDYLITTYPNSALMTGEGQKIFTTNVKQHVANTTNQIYNTIPHTTAAKTGYTDVAGGNLVVVSEFGLNRPLYFVVLGSTVNGRFSDIESMYNSASQALSD